MGRIVPGCIAKEFMQKYYFLLYTPLEMEIRPARSVRKRFCSFSFARLYLPLEMVGTIVPTSVGKK